MTSLLRLVLQITLCLVLACDEKAAPAAQTVDRRSAAQTRVPDTVMLQTVAPDGEQSRRWYGVESELRAPARLADARQSCAKQGRRLCPPEALRPLHAGPRDKATSRCIRHAQLGNAGLEWSDTAGASGCTTVEKLAFRCCEVSTGALPQAKLSHALDGLRSQLAAKSRHGALSLPEDLPERAQLLSQVEATLRQHPQLHDDPHFELSELNTEEASLAHLHLQTAAPWRLLGTPVVWQPAEKGPLLLAASGVLAEASWLALLELADTGATVRELYILEAEQRAPLIAQLGEDRQHLRWGNCWHCKGRRGALAYSETQGLSLSMR